MEHAVLSANQVLNEHRRVRVFEDLTDGSIALDVNWLGGSSNILLGLGLISCLLFLSLIRLLFCRDLLFVCLFRLLITISLLLRFSISSRLSLSFRLLLNISLSGSFRILFSKRLHSSRISCLNWLLGLYRVLILALIRFLLSQLLLL